MWRCLEDLLVMAPGLRHRFSRVECEKGHPFADRYCSGNDDDDDDDDDDATAVFSCRTQLLVYQLSRIYRS